MKEWRAARGEERGGRQVPLVVAVMGAAAVLTGAQCASDDDGVASARETRQETTAVIPQPARLTRDSGEFVIASGTTIWTDDASAAIGRQLAAYLAPATGFTLE